ncbi:MAG TPA: DUF935 family protein, partial [Acidobacteriota bacterium]|nr:DUF935 family protein [Acidobacteriota bacterium]
YNFPGVSAYPKIKTYAGAKPDLTAQSQIDKTLAVDIGLPIGRSYFYETYGIPEPEKGEELVNVPPKAQPFGGLPGSPFVIPAQSPSSTRSGTGTQAFTENAALQDAADLIANQTALSAMNVTDEIYMAPLKRLAAEAKSLEDLRDRILDLWGEMELGDLGTIMARGMMLAEMAGRYEVKTEGKVPAAAFVDSHGKKQNKETAAVMADFKQAICAGAEETARSRKSIEGRVSDLQKKMTDGISELSKRMALRQPASITPPPINIDVRIEKGKVSKTISYRDLDGNPKEAKVVEEDL